MRCGFCVGLGVAFNAGQKASVEAPGVGECARQVGENSIEATSCTSADASLRVTSRVDDMDDIGAACASDAEATSGDSCQESSHGVGLVTFVLCLADN